MHRTNSRSCVTILGYLMGVSDYVLERDYLYDYNKVLSIGFLDELNIVRSFNKVRQNIFKNYKYYKNTYLGDVSNTYVDEDLVYLKNNGYDLYNVSLLDSSAEYLLNYIKKEVDYLVPSVLDRLNLQYVDELTSLFSFPIFDKKSLLNFVTGLKGRSLPHGIIVPKYKRIQTSLQYLLSNDTTLYAGAFSLSEKEFSPIVNVIKEYDWYSIEGFIEPENDSYYYYRDTNYEGYEEEYDEDYEDYSDEEEEVKSNVIDSSVAVSNDDINDSIKASNCTENTDVYPTKCVGQVQPSVSVVPSSDNKSSAIDVKNKIIDNTVHVVRSCNKYFVDCDNIDFFKFLSMLDTLEDYGVRNVDFHLYMDLKATYLWAILDDIRTSKSFNFIYKNVDRIKGNKSVVDLVMTVDVCKEVMEKGSTSIGLISSDSDFYGVIDNINNVDFVVGYNSECTSGSYLHYLSKNNFRKFDVKVFEKEETLLAALDEIVTYLVLSILSQIAMVSWDLDVLLESVKGGIEKESSFTIDDNYLKNKIDEILNNLKVSVKDGTLDFSYGDISIKMNK